LPDFHIIETLRSGLESRARSGFPPPSALEQLEDILHEECYSIPLETLQNLCESIPKRTQSVLQASSGPTPYK